MATKSSAVARAKINLPVDVNAMMAAEVAEIQKRISAPTGNRITVTQSKKFKLPNGLETSEPIECIIVDFAAANYYYTDTFDRDNIVPPVCFSVGLEPAGMIPSDTAPDKQGGSCASCWANQFGSASVGKGKACQNTRMLAVIPLDADVDAEIWTIKVSATAIRAFDAYIANVARAYSMPVRGVVTELSFDQESEWASLRFRAIGPAPKDLVLLANTLKQDALTVLLTPPMVQSDEAKPIKGPANRKPAAAAKRPAQASARR